MEREHLIIIALILVALYMMNTDTKDTVQAIGPMGRIRYTEAGPTLELSNLDRSLAPNHIRTRREGFMVPDSAQEGDFGFGLPNRIRYSDKSFAHSQHIKNHIRSRNTNSMFSGMTTGSCGEGFRFTCSTDAGCESSAGGCCY